MATIKATGILDGTSCYAQVVVTQISRTKNSIKLSCVVSSGYTGTGYTEAEYESYTGNFILSGNGFTTKTTNFIAKNKQTAWSGQGEHYKQEFTVDLPTTIFATNQTLNIKLNYSTSVGGTISQTGTQIISAMDSNIYVKENGTWKKAFIYLKNETWKISDTYLKNNNDWKFIS